MPETIDRYEVLQKLASGGMAELFLAKQSGMEGFEKVVVIKRILPHLASDQEFVGMFLDEARIAAKLSHPNVVQIYDLGRADDTFYIAMEYVSGRNVAAVIKKARDGNGYLPVEHTARIMAGVCDGLYYAHTRKDYDGKPLNIIHRDISPQNILVSFAGGVKLVDFGIAKASTQLAQTRAGVLKGKYSYMSPEQVRGDKIDGRSDLFAVGIVMYEMLTAQRPFERDNSLKTLKAIVQEKPLNPRDLNPAVPTEIVKILSKALEKDPNRRYANAQEMQLALEDWLDRSPSKSNNVRISRYLYDLFDDELNSEGGTLEVKGIGEIIIPTGTNAGQAPDAKSSTDGAPQEEIPESTISAALAEVEAAHDKKVREREEQKKSATPAPPAAPPPPQPAPRATQASPAPSRPTPSAAAQPEDFDEGTDPSLVAPDAEATGGATDEMDGATIPAYDLEKYEQERLARRAESETKPGADDGGTGVDDGEPANDEDADPTRAVAMPDPPAPAGKPNGANGHQADVGDGDGFDDSPTMNMDAAMRKGLLDKLAQARAAEKGGGTSTAAATAEAPAPVSRSSTGQQAKAPLAPARKAEPAPSTTPRPAARPSAPVPAVSARSGPVVMDDDEVVPGIGGGPIRPAAGPASAGVVKPLEKGPGLVAPKASAAALRPVKEAPQPSAPEPPRHDSTDDAHVPNAVTGEEPVVSLPLPPMPEAPPPTTPAPAPPAAPPAQEAPRAAKPPRKEKPPAAPRAPMSERRKAVLAVGGAAVVGLVVAVGIVFVIVGKEGMTGAGHTPGVDPPPVADPQLPVDGATGKIKVTSAPSGGEIFVAGVKQDVLTPAIVEAPVGMVVISVTREDYETGKLEVLVEKDKKADAHLALVKKK